MRVCVVCVAESTMLPSCFFFFFILCFWLLSGAPLCLHCAHITGRRILHQPFLPLDSLPPSEPPSLSPPSPPTTPKFPFSSTSTPNNSPFFPSYPAPPPPPPPSTFASFPANISSLILPHTEKSKPNSSKLLILAITAVISAALVAGVLLFLYCRRRVRNRNFADDSKTFTSDNSHRVYPPPPAATRSNSNKLRTTSTTSSEFLYLGTLVNSRGIDESSDSYNNGGNANARSDSQKLESPELRPLPPLSRQTFRQNCEVGSVGEEDEEFYSPRGSLGGRESLSGTGSCSRRVFAGAAAEEFGVRNSESSTCSCSSSGSGSPPRSLSISISPPVSLSPRRSEPKSSEPSAAVQIPSPPPAPLPPQRNSPERVVDSDTSPRISNVSDQNVRSPSLSLASTSPDTGLVKHPDISPRISISSDQNVRSPLRTSASPSPARDFEKSPDVPLRTLNEVKVRSPLRSSVSTSPDRGLQRTPDASPRKLNDLRRNVQSPLLSSATTSPERVLESKSDACPRISIVTERIMQLHSLSSSASSSPDRVLNKSASSSPQVFDRNGHSPLSSSPSSSPERDLENSPHGSPRRSNVSDQNLESPVETNSALKQPISVPPPPRPPRPPPPPPPPLPLLPRRIWENSNPSTPVGQPITMPPPLIPPSRPFVIQNAAKISPVELPPSSNTAEPIEETPKPKLKPLHWDKVRASSDREMVWDHLRSSSFKLNEEMIETLFVVSTPNSKPKQATPGSVPPPSNQENRVLDPKKAQNIAILLRALNVTMEEVCEGLLEGNPDTLGTELLESLLKMAPTKEEERKLKEYKDDSPVKLGAAEKFLKAVLDVPFAFKRVEAMLYMANFESEAEYLKKSFETLEAACEELRNSRMFLKLLEAVLKTGNRMNVGTNRGDAHAFKLDTLLKLVDVKGADGKTTLLHFVVQEIIRTEGARLSSTSQAPNSTSEDARCRKLGLQVVSGLSSELTNVKKAAAMDSDVLSSEVAKLSRGLGNIIEVLQLTMASDGSSQKFSESMNRFMKMADEEIIRIQAQESVAMSLVKEITEYFHGNSAKEEAHPFRIFMVVRDFLTVLDRVCKEVGMINERTIVSSAHKFPVPVNPTLPQVFPGRRPCSSSDDESTSP